ncbi:MAG: BadF/BadG/BcrA/BcrD ATPase family protein [Bacteroidales bacterium]|nr:BadF/BadG/BcrA/BcrD ATPase family protein [Bacteroidales bacterium]
MDFCINVGIDVGSTTVKIVITNDEHELIYKKYIRHFAEINKVVLNVLKELHAEYNTNLIRLAFTGSAGMGIAERGNFDFIQEVIASSKVIQKKFPDINTLVDIGGEDSKMVFFEKNKLPDIRMNGSCAGGTGAFIDQMASLMGVEVDVLNELAQNADTVYPIASRCGVFSKTDIQNLISRNVSKENIAASIFHAVSIQIISSLSRAYDLKPKVMLCGGPFAYIAALRKAFIKASNLHDKDIVLSLHAEVIPAWGASIHAYSKDNYTTFEKAISTIETASKSSHSDESHALKRLFENDEEIESWKKSKNNYVIPEISMENADLSACFLGIDGGSTTTKIVVLDKNENLIFHSYNKNQADTLKTVSAGLNKLFEEAEKHRKKIIIASSCVTGYGEDLIQKAFQLDYGMVETIAHFAAAKKIHPKVSFILDIGGQDMKAVFIEKGIINRLEINEACSSGCGSFIETFAENLNYSAENFANLAITSKKPCDLGTRCTVFMNSKVKQSLREGAEIADISAGLGYSVIKNCLHKVLKIKDLSLLGEHIVVQGGTFRNTAVIRALELETGKKVMISNYPELMGAYGAALYAKDHNRHSQRELSSLIETIRYEKENINCKGCENQCTISIFKFDNHEKYIAGNKCEKVFSNSRKENKKGSNLVIEKYDLLFNRETSKKDGQIKLGIPRALGLFESYPFWHALFENSNIDVVLSDHSSPKILNSGASGIMSDNICLPAKITNGHILNLISKKVDRIFVPFVVLEKAEDKQSINSFNCPIVSSYSEVLKSAINPLKNHQIPLDAPTFNFRDEKLLEKACFAYVKSINPALSTSKIKDAIKKAFLAQIEFEEKLTQRSQEIINHAVLANRLIIVLAGRPYHADPFIQHKISELIAGFDVDVITEDIARDYTGSQKSVQSIMQWAFTNRIIKSALWASEAPSNVHFVQLTSFGCGPDAFILDEITDILRQKEKNATFIKIDDIQNLGSTKLRIRSLIESIKLKTEIQSTQNFIRKQNPAFTKSDQKRKILMPWFGDFYSPFLPPLFKLMGYEAENLPPSDRMSTEFGLQFSNNEVCYPATLIIGDFIKALKSGKYNPDEIALGITQTGGQCRATNYLVLLKKALISAGFDTIPVISVSSDSGTINHQPGFKVNWLKIHKTVINTMVYADCIAQMYYATAPREKEKGITKKLKDKYINLGIEAILKKDTKTLYHLAESAADEFTSANTLKNIPRAGIVGEIYVKYNNYGNKNIIEWLINQEIEPIVPALFDFFSVAFPNETARINGHVSNKSMPRFALSYIEKYIYKMVRKMESKISRFPYASPLGNPHEDAKLAESIININAQFGEGWRIPSEIARFAEMGVNNIVSLQPFGCIANHIISKGVEKRIKELYPLVSILYLDFDSGMSEANIINRLHFLSDNATEEVQHSTVKASKIV